MFNKGLFKLALTVFVISVVAIGSGICADVANQDAKKTDVMSKMSTRNAIRFSKEIGLSDKQQEKIKAIQKQSIESMQAFMTGSKSKREELNLVTKSTDIAVKIKAQSKFADVSKQLMDIRMTEADKIVAVLSAEQKAKLVELSDADMRNAVEEMKVKTQEKPVVEQKK